MNKLDQTVDEYLRAVGASCPRLLFALQQSPEAVWGEIMRLESTCHTFEQACSDLPGKPSAASEIEALLSALRVKMDKDGLVDYEEFAAFREDVSAIERCANRLRNSLGGGDPGSQRRLKICAFYCSNNLDAARLADLGQETGGDTVKVIGLPCSGKVDVPYLVKALETGADGVVIVACKKMECRHFEGSLRAHKRAEAVESLMAEIGLGAGRMAVVECAPGGAEQVREEINQFIERVRSLPRGRVLSETMNKQERMVA